MKSRKVEKVSTRYKVGQEIVYPLQGVGHVETIEERPFQDKKLLYYIIYLEVTDMTVMVPVKKADELGIRPIVGKKESQKALKLISEAYEPVQTDWKMRYQMNLDLLKKGSIIDIANVVRALYHRSKVKELPILERKLYDSALRLLIDEISFSLDKKKDEVEVMIFDRLGAK
jgi:CarD family transcriptional regulator